MTRLIHDKMSIYNNIVFLFVFFPHPGLGG